MSPPTVDALGRCSGCGKTVQSTGGCLSCQRVYWQMPRVIWTQTTVTIDGRTFVVPPPGGES